MKNKKSILEILINSLLGGCMIGLVVGFGYLYFIPSMDFLLSFVDKNSMQYVYDQFDPFRVALYSGFGGSFLAFLLSGLYERRNHK